MQLHWPLLKHFVQQISSLFYPLANCPVQEYMKALADMRRDRKDKELDAFFQEIVTLTLASLRYICGIILRNLSEELTI